MKPQKLVECIPNFSEGRRPEVIEAILSAVQAVPGVQILNHSSDPDHNRTVITFAGTPEAVLEAAYAGIRKASELIDLTAHDGVHPFIGATDVVPFVPLSGVTLEECVSLAERLGRRVGEELNIPVYLYESAAKYPDRKQLENIRRGGYQVLKETIAVDPDRAPDFGPSRLGTAGAVVIGVRPLLIAFNAFLTTDDVEIAQKIALAIRHSSGGFRYLKALGLLVDGRAQVSMNFTDFTQTPLARVVEAIRREAAHYGTAIHHTELIGLIPNKALVDAAEWYLQLEVGDQILESRLDAVFADNVTSPFLEQLAAGTAAPGGGAAAAYAGAMAASLAGMAARLTIGKPKYAVVESRMQQIAIRADELRSLLDAGVSADAESYSAVMQAYRLPKSTDVEQSARALAIEQGLMGAIETPLTLIRHVVEVLDLLAEVAEIGNVNTIADAASGARLAQASVMATALNIRVNAANLNDQQRGAAYLQDLQTAETAMTEAIARVDKAVQSRLKVGGSERL